MRTESRANPTETENKPKVNPKKNESELVERAKSGCARSVADLYMKNKKYQINKAKVYHHLLPLEEIEGCYDEGFFYALQKYDKSKDASKICFTSYLSRCVKQQVFKEISKNKEIYIPPKIRSKASKIINDLKVHNATLSEDYSTEKIEISIGTLGYVDTNPGLIKSAIDVINESCVDWDDVEESTSYVDSVYECAFDLILGDKFYQFVIDLIETYCPRKEVQVIKNIFSVFMECYVTGDSYRKVTKERYGYSSSITHVKLNNLLIQIKSYLECQGIDFADFEI